MQLYPSLALILTWLTLICPTLQQMREAEELLVLEKLHNMHVFLLAALFVELVIISNYFFLCTSIKNWTSPTQPLVADIWSEALMKLIRPEIYFSQWLIDNPSAIQSISSWLITLTKFLTPSPPPHSKMNAHSSIHEVFFQNWRFK